MLLQRRRRANQVLRREESEEKKIGIPFVGSVDLMPQGLLAWLAQVAIKLESTKTKHPQLLYESKIYRILHGGREFVCEFL